VHNPNLVISQQIRDILLRYYYSSRENRLFQCEMYWCPAAISSG
jgi:hypothetical protein